MRRLVLSLSAFVVSAASLAAPADESLALRPTLPPLAEPALRTASRSRTVGPAPPKSVFAISGNVGVQAQTSPFGSSGAPGQGSFPAEQVSFSPEEKGFGLPGLANDPFVATQTLDAALRRQLGAAASEWQYFFPGARPPAWIGVSAANDFFRRQDHGAGLGQAAWKGGWEIGFAPTGSTMAYAKGTSSETMRRALVEGKAGIALFDDPSLFGLPFGKLYFGPFAVVHGLRFDEDTRFGAHLTFAQIGLFQIGMAGGYARARIGGGGAFGLLESSFTF